MSLDMIRIRFGTFLSVFNSTPMNRIAKSFLLVFPSLILSACSNPFTSTYSDRHEATVARQEIVAQTQTLYHLQDIPSCSGSLLVAPDDPALDRIVSILSQARSHIEMEVYILTEKKIIDALIDAHRRGVAVRVLLERNVFGSRGMNSKSAKQLTDAGISVSYADNTTYKLTHAKYIIADDTYIVSTGNMSHSTFTKNREYFWIGDDPADRSVLSRVFAADTGSGHTDVVSGSGLVLSPWDSRAKLDIILKEAKTSLLVTNQSIEDKMLVDDLVAAQARGVDVRVVTEDTAAKS